MIKFLICVMIGGCSAWNVAWSEDVKPDVEPVETADAAEKAVPAKPIAEKSAVQAGEINYDAVFDLLLVENKASWAEYIEMLEEDEDEEAAKTEIGLRDAYLAVLAQIKLSTDVKVKNAMIIYEYKSAVSLAKDDVEYAETIVEKMTTNAKLVMYTKRLDDFQEQLANAKQ